jgi:toxin FitB
MYLIDTDVISETRKKSRANAGVTRFFVECVANEVPVFISVITVGEVRRGVELIRHRGDISQADNLDTWLNALLVDYADYVLDFSLEEAQVWGRLRVPKAENPLDKQIAATALTHDLKLVTRNVAHFEGLGVTLLNPFG